MSVLTPSGERVSTKAAAIMSSPSTRERARVVWLAIALFGPAVFLAVSAYRRRWIGDDGLIFVRVSEQILAGNGPNFNVGERVEAATSTAWPWLIALLGGVTGIELTLLAVYFSLVLSVVGLVVASVAARRLYGDSPGARWPVPAGALVVAVLPPFWDFATSGLEMGLIFAWLGTTWFLLIGLDRETSLRRAAATVFLLGFGVLVRPDLAIVTVVFGAAAWLLMRPSWRRLLLLLTVGGALPVAYQIFRMGYYGMTLPNTAIAKEGSESEWSRGWTYFSDYFDPYVLWIPLVLLLVSVVATLFLARNGSWFESRTFVLVTAALLSGIMLLGYVTMVGGDFMHGRLLLPGTFALLLPVMVVPKRPLHVNVAAGVAVWSAVCAVTLRVPYPAMGPNMIEDTRAWYQQWTFEENPMTDDAYKSAFFSRLKGLHNAWVEAGKDPNGQVVFFTYYHNPKEFWRLNFDFRAAPVNYHVKVTDSIVYGALGQPAVVVPTSGLAIDIFGLANPLGSHLELDYRTRSGHDKLTPPEWIVADFIPEGVPIDMRNLDPAKVTAARNALKCAEIAELREATRAPMSWSRFWDNLTGAFSRTSLRIPTDPIEAEKKFCG